jgi:hypothetical protein
MGEKVQTGRLIPYLTEMFRLQAWMAMGKVANPATGKVERDLTVARMMIDLLVELEQRTEGHRSDDETRLLQGAVTELQLNYVDEAKKPAPEPESEESPRAETPPTDEPEASDEPKESKESSAPDSQETKEKK